MKVLYRIFAVMLLAMLIILMFRVTSSNGRYIDDNGFIVQSESSDIIIPRFAELLNYFQNDTFTLQIPVLTTGAITSGDWGVFNFLKIFIESLASIVNVAVFLINAILQVLGFVFYFLDWLFL